MRVGLVTAAFVALLVLARAVLPPDGVAFAFVAVWAPMTWLGTISRWVPPRLPAGWYRLRGFEGDGRLHELLGARAAKALLRRGPIAAFNPHLHLPAEWTPAALADLERHMEVAEASHVVAGAIGLGVAALAAAHGWWAAAVWTVVFDVLLNGYPVLLQRYNRALLHGRASPASGEVRGR